MLGRKIEIVIAVIIIIGNITGCHRKSNIYGEQSSQENHDSQVESLQEESLDNMPCFGIAGNALAEEYEDKGYQIERESGESIVNNLITEVGFDENDKRGVGTVNVVIDDKEILSNEQELEGLHDVLAVFFLAEYKEYNSSKIEECLSTIPDVGSLDFAYDDKVAIVAQYLHDQIHMTIHPKYE